MARGKIYYKVIVRICEIIERQEKKKIYNEGFVIIENNDFEGYLALDYIEGVINNIDKNFSIQIIDFINSDETFIFSGEIEEFELPGQYILETELSKDNKICYLDFKEIEKNPIKQKEVEETLKQIKKLHKITN